MPFLKKSNARNYFFMQDAQMCVRFVVQSGHLPTRFIVQPDQLAARFGLHRQGTSSVQNHIRIKQA